MLMVVMAAAAVIIMFMVMVLMLMMVVTAAAVIIMFMVMMLMLMVVMAAAAVIIMFMVMVLMLMMVVTAAAMFLMVMVMMIVLMVVMAAAAMLLVVMVMVLMFMVVMAAAAMLLMIMMMVVMFMLQFFQGGSNGSFTLHSGDQLRSGQLTPGSCNHGSVFIMFPEHSDGLIQLILRNGISSGEDNGSRCLDLVVVELTEVLHINLDLTGIGNCHSIAQLYTLYFFYRADDIGQLAHTGGFNDHTVRMILRDHLLQSLTKVTNQAAANTAGVHFGNIDTGILQETAVNTDLAELILDQHQLLSAVTFRDHFLNQCRFSGAQKAGINIDFGH